ncbi:hypothetical protein [Neopusillimonas aromaticivorans]|jgi:hypothetical protein|uniref:hypothetical protein n=1 Tax=Neopusillimonas aromaticivorans TaxID=2979868 RepID=UPI002591CC43|nr:hypothetical protein [Neopusillimonas aromaticivorans]WJJ93883.1 hypothetical protein N7E01_01135 [Neopusillimonas aromaticivorans]
MAYRFDLIDLQLLVSGLAHPLSCQSSISFSDAWASRELNICTRDPAALSPLARKLVDFLVQGQ